MKYRKNIPISEMTERELIRWHMEKVTNESYDDIASDCAMAMAKLYKSFHDGNTIMWLTFGVFFQLCVNSLVLIIKLFGSER